VKKSLEVLNMGTATQVDELSPQWRVSAWRYVIMEGSKLWKSQSDRGLKAPFSLLNSMNFRGDFREDSP
jgi:hypothetical protein